MVSLRKAARTTSIPLAEWGAQNWSNVHVHSSPRGEIKGLSQNVKMVSKRAFFFSWCQQGLRGKIGGLSRDPTENSVPGRDLDNQLSVVPA